MSKCCGGGSDSPIPPPNSSDQVVVSNGKASGAKDDSVMQVKLVLLGASGVGKTNIGRRFLSEEFSEGTEVTVGAAYCTLDHQVKNKGWIRYAIWDTAGQERFGSLTPMYYRGAGVAIIVYDITSEDSLERAKKYVREVKENVPGAYLYLVGNKADLSDARTVQWTHASEYAQEFGLPYMETSAKTGHNCMELLNSISEAMIIRKR